MCIYIYIYVYIHICICICMYIYIYIERERERERTPPPRVGSSESPLLGYVGFVLPIRIARRHCTRCFPSVGWPGHLVVEMVML